MDPRMARRGGVHASMRFPRPRGDGPVPRSDRAESMHMPVSPPTRGWTLADRRDTNTSIIAVSPPTRGWTPRAVQVDPGLRAFPAHAGMDPGRDAERIRRVGFPRPRGDGPRPIRGGSMSSPVSPPTRGWTLVIFDRIRLQRGFPAHAGMDPVQRAIEAELLVAVSPPTRGWTLHREHQLLG